MNTPDLQDELNQSKQRIEELETRIVYLEDLVESLNSETAHLGNEFALAKQAMQLMNRRLEQLTAANEKSDIPIDRPPHY